jgi:hypothetical protein
MGSGSEIGANKYTARQMGVALSEVEMDSELGAAPWGLKGKSGFPRQVFILPCISAIPPSRKVLTR